MMVHASTRLRRTDIRNGDTDHDITGFHMPDMYHEVRSKTVIMPIMPEETHDSGAPGRFEVLPTAYGDRVRSYCVRGAEMGDKE
ncbi:hypothetical protein DDE01_18500 [Desulfovibrio desulfuricans]|nr:hypothetical protein DDE01_18500 [Desulfovibrio desulfuricans]